MPPRLVVAMTGEHIRSLMAGNFHSFCVYKMKLIDVLILSLAAAFVIIGIHQIMMLGFANGYWAVMVAFFLFFVYTYRKRN